MIARTSQSRHIARAIPITPRLHQIPRSTDKTNRTPMVVKREIPVVNRTSPVARSPFPRGSANGKTTAFAILWIRTSQITRCLVCSIKSGMIIHFNCLLEKNCSDCCMFVSCSVKCYIIIQTPIYKNITLYVMHVNNSKSCGYRMFKRDAHWNGASFIIVIPFRHVENINRTLCSIYLFLQIDHMY